MGLDKLLSRVLVIGSLSLGSYNCDSSSPDSCIKDTDCKGDRICVSSVCQQQGSYGGADTSGSGKYTCETACNHLANCGCWDGWEGKNKEKNLSYCISSDCGSTKNPWLQSKIDYVSTAKCIEVCK